VLLSLVHCALANQTNGTLFGVGPFPQFTSPLLLQPTGDVDGSLMAVFECAVTNKANVIYLRIGNGANYLQAMFSVRKSQFTCKGNLKCRPGYANGIQSLTWGFLEAPVTRIEVHAYPNNTPNALVIAMGPNGNADDVLQYNGFFDGIEPDAIAIMSQVKMSARKRIIVQVSS